MKSRQFWRSVGFYVAIGGALSAVVYSSRATAAAQLPESTTSRDVVSATGCVERATPAEKTAGGDSLDGGFMLRGVKVGPRMGLAERPALPPTSPGTPASSEGSQATNTAEPGSGAPPREARASGADIAGAQRDSALRLVADRGIELGEHVGHRVLVTGRLSSFAAPGGVPSTASGRTLTVTKVSLISIGCTVGS
jgi:hypothetical protein